MTRNKFGHFKHRNGLFAVEDRLELVVGVDLGPHLGILKFVLLDVVPEFFRQVGPRERLRANDSGQQLIGLDGLEKSGVGFAR